MIKSQSNWNKKDKFNGKKKWLVNARENFKFSVSTTHKRINNASSAQRKYQSFSAHGTKTMNILAAQILKFPSTRMVKFYEGDDMVVTKSFRYRTKNFGLEKNVKQQNSTQLLKQAWEVRKNDKRKLRKYNGDGFTIGQPARACKNP